MNPDLKPEPDLCAALRKAAANPLPLVKGQFFKVCEGRLCGCAMGQAALAAGVVTRPQALGLARKDAYIGNIELMRLLPKSWTMPRLMPKAHIDAVNAKIGFLADYVVPSALVARLNDDANLPLTETAELACAVFEAQRTEASDAQP